MTTILLVRHGQSTWNLEGRWQGQADPPLTDLGQQQARLAAMSLGATDGIVASPLERARHTASIIGAELGLGPIGIIDDLVERNVGSWSGLTFAEIEQRWPGAVAQRRWPADFEADADVAERATRALLAIAEYFPGGQAIAVTHGGVLHALDTCYGMISEGYPNLSGRVLQVEGSDIRVTDKLHLAPRSATTGGQAHRPVQAL